MTRKQLAKKTVSLRKTEQILAQHGINGVYDTSTGSSLAGTLGLRTEYNLLSIADWLGY